MMTLGDMITKMNDEQVEDVNAMVTALSGDSHELVEALVTSLDLIRSDQTRAEQFHVLIGVLGFGVAIGYYRALQQYDGLLGLAQTVRDRREGKGREGTMLNAELLRELEHPDELQRLLATAYAAALHAHTCGVCRKLRVCTVVGCEMRRFLVKEREYVCFVCRSPESAGDEVGGGGDQ